MLTYTRFGPKHVKGALPTTDEESFEIQEYHFIKGQVLFSYNFTDRREMTTIGGKNLTFYVAPNGTRYVNDAPIVASDYLISTGVFHVIETVLDPRTPDAKPRYLTEANMTDVNATATPKPSSTAQSSSAGTETSGLSTGAKAGIGVGVTLGILALLGAAVLFLLRSRRQQRAVESQRTEKPGRAETQHFPKPYYPQELEGKTSLHEIHSQGTSGRGEMEGSQDAQSRRAVDRGQTFEMQ